MPKTHSKVQIRPLLISNIRRSRAETPFLSAEYEINVVGGSKKLLRVEMKASYLLLAYESSIRNDSSRDGRRWLSIAPLLMGYCSES